MRHTPETRTLQVWPSGNGYSYRGDLYAPAKERRLRRANHDGGKPEPWRKGTPDEWRKIRIEVLAERYSERDILCCDSCLVNDLLKAGSDQRGDLAEGFSLEEIRNMYKDPSDWDMEKCHEYATDQGMGGPNPDPWEMDRAAIVEALTDASIECKDDESLETLREALIANMDDETIDGLQEWRDACRDNAQENPAEVYEWWRVSSWLCGQFHDIGEVTIDNGYGHWWGRTCTGQQYIMDGTLQEIAARFEREDR